MRTQHKLSRRGLTRIAGVALVALFAAGAAVFVNAIPTSIGSVIVAPAELPTDSAQSRGAETVLRGIRSNRARCPDCGVIESTREVRKPSPSEANGTDRCADRGHAAAVTGGSNQSAENADLAILLEWHMNARSAYSSIRHGIGCAAQAAIAAPLLIEASKAYEILVRFRDGSSQVLTEASLSTWRQGERVKVVTEMPD